MSVGKSIRIYLKDGNVTGIKLAEVVNLTIQALACPRNKISDMSTHFSLAVNTPGVYFLIGEDDKTGRRKVYIGESENVWERLKNHDINKDFWTEVVLFTSKDDNLTKSHVKFLESKLVDLAKVSDRYILENGNTPVRSSLPLPDRDAMEEFALNIKLLTGTLGHTFLEDPIADANTQKLNPLNDDSSAQNSSKQGESLKLFLEVGEASAKAIQSNEGLVVLEGSRVAKDRKGNYGYKTLREKLLREEIIGQNKNGELVFRKNHLFDSPSAAAAVLVDYSINGRGNWKDQSGRTLNDLEKLELE